MCQIPRRGRGGAGRSTTTRRRCDILVVVGGLSPFPLFFLFFFFLFFEVNKVEGCYFRAKAAATSSSTTSRGLVGGRPG